MRLVVDMQCAQSESRFRGIGRYALGLAKTIARLMADEAEDELFVFVNETSADGAAQLRRDFAGLVPPERIRGYYSVGAIGGFTAANDERRGVSEVIRESALCALRPDAVLVMSLFEGFGGGAATSIKGFVDHLPTAAILYDLIPLAASEQYLADGTVRAWYERKLVSLRNADLLLAISTSASDQATQLLGVPTERVVTIGTGLDSRFSERSIEPEAARAVFEQLGIERKAVLYAGGFDRRKNIDVLIEAFAALDIDVRESRQLVIAGRCPPGDLARLTRKAETCGLTTDDVVFTGHVADDELVALYRQCELFVFPSTMEGFGLPPIEALACGAPVLSVETPSMIGLQPAERLVPDGVEPLRAAMDDVLRDVTKRESLRVSAARLAERFDWHRVATVALQNLRALARRRGTHAADLQLLEFQRPRLAIVAPLPAVVGSVADHYVGLIPALHRHYVVEIVVDDADVDTSWIPEWIPLRSLAWFEDHGGEFDRVLYHVGNSRSDARTVALLARFPGAVVLPDFFLGDLHAWLPALDEVEPSRRAIAHGHGPAGRLLAHELGLEVARKRLPCSLEVLEQADVAIVPRAAAVERAELWFGRSIARKHVVIPPGGGVDRLPRREQARNELGIAPDETLVIAFVRWPALAEGFGAAWSALDERRRSTARLVLLGADALAALRLLTDRASPEAGRSTVDATETLSLANYRSYLASADLAVCLDDGAEDALHPRLLDALGAGIPVIANESTAEDPLPGDVARIVPRRPAVADLAMALDELVGHPTRRAELGRRGRQFVKQGRDWTSIARRYATAIESGVRFSPRRHAARLEGFAADWAGRTVREPAELEAMARAIAHADHPVHKRRLFVDVSAIATVDLRTGIQRVVRALLLELMRSDSIALRVEPIRADLEHRQYRYARHYLSTLLGDQAGGGDEEIVDMQPGDIFLGLDLAGEFVAVLPEWFRIHSERGVRIVFVAYDLLPVRMPEFFPEGMDIAFAQWLQMVGKVADQVLCISEAVASDLVEWLKANQPLRMHPLTIGSFRLGADLVASAPTLGMPSGADELLRAIRSRPSFLMVGTVEPRKGHAQVLAAFEQLWDAGRDMGLVIVGKSGWLMDAFLAGVSEHPEFGRRLFWLERITDEFLDHVYPACIALIAASRGEGFGLPLIESAKHGLPIIARDLPVFREVAGDHAFYFSGTTAADLADALDRWMSLRASDGVPGTAGIALHTWKESATQVIRLLTNDHASTTWDTQIHIARGEVLPFDSVKLDWEGWSSIERWHRWTEGRRARIRFFLSRDAGLPKTLELLIGTFGRQAIAVHMNGTVVYEETLDLADGLLSIALPKDALFLGEHNWIDFALPDAHSPGPHDLRRLSIHVKWLRFL